MAAVTGGFSFVGFQFFVLFLIKGWRIYPVEVGLAFAIGALLGWAFFPKSVGQCIKIGIITGLAAGYILVIMASKKV